jgi:hypothetical protein
MASPIEKGPAMSLIENSSKASRRKIVATSDTLADDRLDGAAAIGAFLGITPRKAFHKLAAGHIPHTREGDRYVGSKRQLTKHYTGE